MRQYAHGITTYCELKSEVYSLLTAPFKTGLLIFSLIATVIILWWTRSTSMHKFTWEFSMFTVWWTDGDGRTHCYVQKYCTNTDRSCTFISFHDALYLNVFLVYVRVTSYKGLFLSSIFKYVLLRCCLIVSGWICL